MKSYNYTARDKNNALVRGSIQAADRTAALAELRSRELVPTAVEDGLATADFKVPSFKVSRTVWVLSGVLAALVCVWVAVRLMPVKKPVHAERKAEVKKVQKVAKATPTPARPPVKVAEPAKPKVAATPLPGKLPDLVLPATNSIAQRLLQDGRQISVPGLHRDSTNTPNPYATFVTRSERMMSMMLHAKPGEMILNLSVGRDFSRDFAASLTNVIEIYETDSEEMAAHKEQVAVMKDEMRKLVEAGQNPEDILTAYREQHNEVAKFRSELQRQLSVLKSEGKLDEAETFAQEANKLLEPYGTRPLTVIPAVPLKNIQK